MNKETPVSKIILVSTGIVILAGILCGAINAGDGFAVVLGLVCLAGAIIYLFAGLIFFAAALKNYGKGFLLSCCILFLLSGISCGSGLLCINNFKI